MVAYDLAYLDDLVIGKADTSKELFGNWRAVLLLCFSVVVPEQLFRSPDADVVQKGGATRISWSQLSVFSIIFSEYLRTSRACVILRKSFPK